PPDERAAWTKLRTEVDRLAAAARARCTQAKYRGLLSARNREQSHPLKVEAGKGYVIDMESTDFDAYLRLEASQDKVVAENDDIAEDNLNSRIVFTAPADGSYRIVATSFRQRDAGTYTLTVREYPAPGNEHRPAP